MLHKLFPGSKQESPLLWQASLTSQMKWKVCDLSSHKLKKED